MLEPSALVEGDTDPERAIALQLLELAALVPTEAIRLGGMTPLGPGGFGALEGFPTCPSEGNDEIVLEGSTSPEPAIHSAIETEADAVEVLRLLGPLSPGKSGRNPPGGICHEFVLLLMSEGTLLSAIGDMPSPPASVGSGRTLGDIWILVDLAGE